MKGAILQLNSDDSRHPTVKFAVLGLVELWGEREEEMKKKKKKKK